MCGACGGGPAPDPFGDRVAGPRRRAAVAGAVDARLHGVRVRAVPGGWTVAGRTGRVLVCRTLTELVEAVSRGVDRNWLRDAALRAADRVC